MCSKEYTLGNTALKAKKRHWANRPRDASISFSIFVRLKTAYLITPGRNTRFF